MKDFEGILDFLEFLIKFQQVERVMLVKGFERDENDAEHSFQLAMLAWYIVEVKDLSLDKNKIIKYALVHDLVEAYAGDTYFNTTDQSEINSKEQREQEAMERIGEEFAEFTDLTRLLEAYENKEDKESRFGYALDKIIPVLNIFIDGGRAWHKYDVIYEDLRDKKDNKISESPVVEEIWQVLTRRLEENQEKLFPG